MFELTRFCPILKKSRRTIGRPKLNLSDQTKIDWNSVINHANQIPEQLVSLQVSERLLSNLSAMDASLADLALMNPLLAQADVEGFLDYALHMGIIETLNAGRFRITPSGNDQLRWYRRLAKEIVETSLSPYFEKYAD